MDYLDKTKIYIVLFSSQDPISKSIVCCESLFLFQKCKFSHAGLLFYSDILTTDFKSLICHLNDSFLVIESTLSGLFNDNVYDTCGKSSFGVQVRSLDQLINSYNDMDECYIAVAEIDQNINLSKFTFIISSYLGKSYEKIFTNLLTVHLPIPSIESSSFFCSELVFRILKDLNVDVRMKNAKKVSPNSLLTDVKLKDLVYILV